MDVHAPQVEVEAVQVLGGHQVDGRDAAQLPDERRWFRRRRLVGDVEIVVLDVVAAVSGERKVAVTSARSTGKEPGPAWIAGAAMAPPPTHSTPTPISKAIDALTNRVRTLMAHLRARGAAL